MSSAEFNDLTLAEAARLIAIFRHDEITAARFGQLFGPWQFRARRRLEARHGGSSLGGLCGSRHDG